LKVRGKHTVTAFVCAVAILLLVVIRVIGGGVLGILSSATADTNVYKTVVTSVHDGDTFRADIAGTSESIRVIGVDAPEMDDEVYAAEARASRDYTQALVGQKTVWLVVDVGHERDRYGRILAYVWLVEPPTDPEFARSLIAEETLNGKLLSDGMATSLTVEPNTTYAEIFEATSNQAAENGAGLWQTGVFTKGKTAK
jgi:micrococcal nuclease